MYFSINKIKKILTATLLTFFWIVLFVFGTYGTFENNIDNSGTIFLVYTFPICILFFFSFILFFLFIKSRINIYFIKFIEFQILFSICLIILIGTLQAPEHLLTSVLTLVAPILIITSIFNLPLCKIDAKNIFFIFNLTMYLISMLALIGGLISLYGDTFSIGPIVFYYEKAFWRMNSWYVTSTGLGLLFVYGIFSSFYLIGLAKCFTLKLWLIISVLALIFGMTLAGGRTAFICIIFSFMVTFLYKNRIKTIFLFRAFIFLIFISFITIYIFNSFSEDIYLLRRFTDDDASTLGGRSDLFLQFFQSFSSLNYIQFVFGVGIGGTSEILKWDRSPHSGFLRILIENGPIAISLFVIFIVVTLISLQKKVRYSYKFKNEFYIISLYLCNFFLSEIMVIQLFGISMEFVLFIIVFSFFILFKYLDYDNNYNV